MQWQERLAAVATLGKITAATDSWSKSIFLLQSNRVSHRLLILGSWITNKYLYCPILFLRLYTRSTHYMFSYLAFSVTQISLRTSKPVLSQHFPCLGNYQQNITIWEQYQQFFTTGEIANWNTQTTPLSSHVRNSLIVAKLPNRMKQNNALYVHLT